MSIDAARAIGRSILTVVITFWRARLPYTRQDAAKMAKEAWQDAGDILKENP